MAKVFMSAGEASGDHYGAELIRSMRDDAGRELYFFGLGGAEMRAQGLDALVHTESVSHMGITEVIRHAAYIYRQFHKLRRALHERRPDLAVLIDFPDVNFRLAKAARRLGIPVLWLVSPQLWAWKKRRLRWVQQRVSKMLVIFPFEERFYRERGVAAEYIGHPLADLPLPDIAREDFARNYGLNASKPWIALLPGSRHRELRLNLPAMLEAARQLGSCYDFLLPVAATLARADVKATLQALADSGMPPVVLVEDARAALHHARGSVVASGTATVQAALLGNPFVIVYRMSPLSYRLARTFVSVEFAGMPNLIARRQIVPELLQDRFTGPNVVAALEPLLRHGPERDRQMQDLAKVAAQLRLPLCRQTGTRGEQLPNQSDATDNETDAASAMSRAARAAIRLLPT